MHLLILAVLVGLVILFGVGTFMFQAGCALADVPDRGYFRALPVYSATLVVCLPLAGLLIWFFGRYDADPSDWLGGYHIAAAVAALLLTWVLSAGIYSLLLSASLRKGILIAAFELLLSALLSALVAALVLVVLAIVQINMRQPTKASRTADQDALALTFGSRLHQAGKS